jgi:hypothetical protein
MPVDWGFLGRFLELCIDLLITISSAALQLMSGSIFGDVLPNLKLQHVRDSKYGMFSSRTFPFLILQQLNV